MFLQKNVADFIQTAHDQALGPTGEVIVAKIWVAQNNLESGKNFHHINHIEELFGNATDGERLTHNTDGRCNLAVCEYGLVVHHRERVIVSGLLTRNVLEISMPINIGCSTRAPQ